MRRLDRDRPGILSGHRVFLSASVPTRVPFERKPDAPFQIEQAVASLVRAVFAEGGRLVFGGHPSISPLVASIAAEYFPVRPGGLETTPGSPDTAPVLIFQSRAFEGFLPGETWEMQRFGFARIVWVDAVNGERFDPELRGQRQCQESLGAMRSELLRTATPTALVAIGGMEGVFDETQLFGRQDRPGSLVVFTLRETGGAAELLAKKEIPQSPDWALLRENRAAPGYRPVQIRVADDEWKRAASMDLPPDRPDPRAVPVPPYPVIMQWLVQEIAKLPHSRL